MTAGPRGNSAIRCDARRSPRPCGIAAPDGVLLASYLFAITTVALTTLTRPDPSVDDYVLDGRQGVTRRYLIHGSHDRGRLPGRG